MSRRVRGPAVGLLFAAMFTAKAAEAATTIGLWTPPAPAAAGAPVIIKNIEKALQAAYGPIVPDKKLRAKLKDLGLPEDDLIAVAQAGEALEVTFVVMLDFDKPGVAFVARARVIDTARKEVRMDFRSSYRKPRSEAKDRARRVSAKTLERLAVFVEELSSGAPPSPPAQPPNEAAPLPERDDRQKPARLPGAPTGPVTVAPRDPPKPPVVERPAVTPPAVERPPVERLSEPLDPAPMDATPRIVVSEQPRRDAEPARPERATAETSVDAPRRPRESLLRIGVSFGSGLSRALKLSTDELETSRLSYSLAPTSLIVGEVELFFPGASAGLLVRGSYSPVRFAVKIDALNEAPAGLIGQLLFALEGRFFETDTLSFLAQAGIRIESLTVDPNSANVVVSSQTLVPFAGLLASLDATESLSAFLGGEVGLTASHTQSPISDGSLSGGFGFAIRGGGIWWLSSTFGLTAEVRFDSIAARLNGASSRQAPAGERLENVSITTSDLRASVGATLGLL
ncbi:MAG: hypothetical protein HYV07_34115 [Deltaproteobacteria bacterium]|nr:hypothetical protein [Deltaproteobacteria bacterium]